MSHTSSSEMKGTRECTYVFYFWDELRQTLSQSCLHFKFGAGSGRGGARMEKRVPRAANARAFRVGFSEH
jgi:hypothetical protein